jgi:hypothetical protein
MFIGDKEPRLKRINILKEEKLSLRKISSFILISTIPILRV